jgi:putative FmdB family regulatory protein
MPLYDYKCRQCEHIYETRHSMNFTGRVTCPECGSDDTRKVISAPASVLDWRLSESVHNSTRFRQRVPNRALAGG